jgi:hypothetical protein
MAPARALALVLALLTLLLPACRRAGENTDFAPGAHILPGLAGNPGQVDRLLLRGAGRRVLVSLERIDGEWRLREREGARADSARIQEYLLRLAQARSVENKTGSPAMYPRIGVEDVSSPEAGGHELELAGQGVSARIIIGKAHALSGTSFARIPGEAPSWRLDTDIGFEPDPVAWLEHRLLDVPIARVDRVRIRPRAGGEFSLAMRDDRFRPEDAPAAMLRDSHAGDDIAAAVQDFGIEDAGRDDGREAERVLDYELVDGAVLSVGVFRDGLRDWARISARLDEARAQDWAARARRAQALAETRAQVAQWQRRFAGRRFLLPPALASKLMLEYSQILQGEAPVVAP